MKGGISMNFNERLRNNMEVKGKEAAKKWETDRIEAYKRYIEHDKQKILEWERSLKEHKEGVKRAESSIQSYKESIEQTIRELSEQGIEVK
jgi:D-mannonate dehydratase